MSDAYDYNSYPPRVMGVDGNPPAAFIFHHTGGGGGVAGVQQTLKDRGLGVQYVMDRDGNITMTGGPGSQHMMKGWGAGEGLSNSNTVGMEVIAKNNADVTPAQVAAAQRFIAQNYPNTPVFGHGEVNPGHKEADEGMSIVNAIRNPDGTQPTAQAQAQPPAAPGAQQQTPSFDLAGLLAKLKGGGSGNPSNSGAGGALASMIAQGATPTPANPNGPAQAPGLNLGSLLGMLGKGPGSGSGGAASGLGSAAATLMQAGSTPQQAPQGQPLTPQELAAMSGPMRPLPLNIPKLIG